jgi:spermidine synthase
MRLDADLGSGSAGAGVSDAPERAAFRISLYGLFIVSGLAGIIYEVLWSRYLSLFLGHSAYAQILVIAIFLGGMSLGALWIGARTERIRYPLRWYILVELAIGLMGVLFHLVFVAVTSAAYESLFPPLGVGFFLQVTKWSISVLLILPQSILLGATFPLISAALLRRDPGRPGRTLSLLYFGNSLGAAAGVLVAGFWLLARSGLPGTLVAAAALNVVIAVGAWLVLLLYGGPPVQRASEESRAELASTPSPASGGDAQLISPGLQRTLIGVAFGTAVASFIYEIGWIRMLSLVFGSATHSFEIMLSAFILGLALGSFWLRKHADRWSRPLFALGGVQWIMGVAALATLPLYTASFAWMAALMRTFASTELGYSGFTLARYGVGLAIMLPATFCAGITLPLITRILVVGGVGERAVGRVYGVNTLGSIVGVAAAGLVLMPWLGLKGMMIVGATLDMLLGAVVLRAAARAAARWKGFALGSAVATAAVVILVLVAGPLDKRLLVSSVYRDGELPPPGALEPVFYQDGRTASVAVTLRTDAPLLFISTNGKADGSLPMYWRDACSAEIPRRPLSYDAASQGLLALIPLAHVPAARSAAVIGQGTGMTSHFLLGSDLLEELVTVEIEPEMVEGSRAFYPENARVFDDPRSRLVIDDAKSFFAASTRQFDVIVSEPSNPWVSGVSDLFTVEFYDRVSGYLSEDGVFAQWLQLYEIDDRLVLTVLASLHRTFRSYAVFQMNDIDIVIVASNEPRLPVPDWSVFQLPAVEADLCHNIRFSPRMLEAARLLDRAALAPLLDAWPLVNSDFSPVLDLGAERARYVGGDARGFMGLSEARFDIGAAFTGRDSPPTEEAIAPVPDIWRMRALAVSAQLRHRVEAAETKEAEPGGAGPSEEPLVPRTRYLVSRWRALLSSERPPPEWRLWLEDMRVAEANYHGGLRGHADADFFREIQEFLERVDAPEVARDVVAFRQGLATWDFDAAAQAGDRLYSAVFDGEGFLPVDEYLDGIVIAKLHRGDATAARRIFDSLVTACRRPRSDLRLLLLDAYISQAEAR